MQVLLAALAFCATVQDRPDTVVVCPPAFLSALEPWIVHRESQGHRLAFVPNTLSAEDIRGEIRTVAKAGRLRHVLLVGDAEPAADFDPAVRARCTPTHQIKARVTARWAPEPDIATDNWFADLDDDGIPDLTIGRWPADSPEELSLFVRRTLQYEQDAKRGDWQRRVHVIAGVGGLGALTDSILEMTTRKFLTEGIPATYALTMTHASWQSQFCPDPRAFHDVTVGRLNEGGLFWVYIGHGHLRHLDYVRVPGGAFHILNAGESPELQCRTGAPIAVLLACYAGAFDKPTDCLAEDMLRAPGGPAAILCASRVTMPYGMAVLGDALLQECFHRRPATLGEALLNAKRQALADDVRSGNRQLMDALAAAFSPAKDLLREERLEHLAQFNLLGDPLLRLPQPRVVELQTNAEITAGETLRIRGGSPWAGKGVLELVCRRDRSRTPPPSRERFQATDEFLHSFQAAYAEANTSTWTAQPFTATGGDFQVDLRVPAEARGPCHVRVFLQGADDVALGATDVFVRLAPAVSPGTTRAAATP